MKQYSKLSKKRTRRYQVELSKADLRNIERLQNDEMSSSSPYLLRQDNTHFKIKVLDGSLSVGKWWMAVANIVINPSTSQMDVKIKPAGIWIVYVLILVAAYVIIDGIVLSGEFLAPLGLAVLCLFVAWVWSFTQVEAMDKIDKHARKVFGGSWHEMPRRK